MCEAAVESPVSYDLNKSQSSKQLHQSKLEKLLERLPKLGEEYDLDRKVGEGTFSSVYVGRSKLDPKLRVAVKHLIPTSHPMRIARELKCMHRLGGVDNIVHVISCFRMNDCVVFVMPYQPHDKFSSYMGKMSAKELQVYLRGLLVALRRVHAHGIIHRDVKPSNFLFHRKTQRFLLVDFGLAQNVEECSSGETSENFTSIKVELNQPTQNSSASLSLPQVDKKRKRDSNEGFPDVLQTAKRPALKLISNNVSKTSADEKLCFRNVTMGKSLSENLTSSLLLPKTSSMGPKDSSLQSKEKTLQTSLVVKRNTYSQPFSDITSVHSKNNLLRLQNSQQVKLMGGVFVKPANPGIVTTASSRNSSSPLAPGKQCNCDGRPRFCNLCITRRAKTAPRAGTPGFRPPEVLLKYSNQTTAVDMWAVGVIMLSVMSSTYPFFKSPDDLTALAELITLFGTEKMKALAKKLGRNIVCSENRGCLDFRKLCEALRRRDSGEENSNLSLLTAECPQCKMTAGEVCLCPTSQQMPEDPRFPVQAYQLLERLLEIDPDSRITAEEALQHPFLSLKL